MRRDREENGRNEKVGRNKIEEDKFAEGMRKMSSEGVI